MSAPPLASGNLRARAFPPNWPLRIGAALFLVYVAYIGGILTLVILLLRAKSSTVLAMGLPIPHSLLLAKKVPYGIAIAIGGYLAFPEAPMVAMRLAGTL